jgi:hypothetical protein
MAELDQAISGLMINNLQPLQRAVYMGELRDNMDIPDYLMSQVM